MVPCTPKFAPKSRIDRREMPYPQFRADQVIRDNVYDRLPGEDSSLSVGMSKVPKTNKSNP